MVSSVPGMIDGEPVMDLRTMNLGSLPMALVNAVKELYQINRAKYVDEINCSER